MSDPRFSHAASAPLFKNIKKANKKLQIDDRFKESLTDQRFGATVGKQKKGRGTASNGNELSEFYETAAAASAVEDERQSKKGGKTASNGGSNNNAGSRLDYLNKLARGEISDNDADSDESDSDGGGSSTRSEDDSSSSEDDDDQASISDDEGENGGALAIPGGGAVELGDATDRVAILNCDWEHIKAVDLMAILESFCPIGGKVKSVVVYVSDYGKEQMAIEATRGPQGIWNLKKAGSDDEDIEDDSEEDASEEEEEEESDDDRDEEQELYKNIRLAKVDESDDDKSDSGGPSDEQGSDESENDDHIEGEFQRQNGASGLVFHDGINKNGSKAANGKSNQGVDEVALRKYELQKLRYYFAVAICDTVATASALYDQLDNIEFENSAMALDLRFVPAEVTNSKEMLERTVRDKCTGVPHGYKPPDFVLTALQHTSVECSWDTGDSERERKLTNVSAWRNLKDSELQQYIASESDSSEEDDELKNKRTKAMRSLLLGNGDEDDAGSDEEDDFFVHDGGDDDDVAAESGDAADGEQVMEFIPGDDGSSRKSVIPENETPLEQARRKQAEKKKRRKALANQGSNSPSVPKKKEKDASLSRKEDDATDSARRAQLEMLFDGDEDDEKDDRLHSNMKDSAHNASSGQSLSNKKSSGKKHKKSKAEDDNALPSDKAPVDVADDRFQQLFSSDGRFGIDRTAPEFRESSEGLKTILAEQQRRREGHYSSISANKNGKSIDTNATSKESDLNTLANKLKRKFNSK